MCAACGVPTHLAEPDVPPTGVAPPTVSGPRSTPVGPRRFAAVRNRDCGPYLVGGMLSMMADNVEHVITYWVLWQRFHSPALTGFEVISHWTPFLLLSVWFGGLADRHDCRRVIQAAQLLFMAVSITWGVLFLTGGLSITVACVLLVAHGVAGSMWSPAEQLMLQDFVGPVELPSAVRLNSTFRSLGILFGPVVGSVLLIGLGPSVGIWVNAAIYLPLTLFLLHTRFTGHTRTAAVARARVGALDAVRVLRGVAADRTLVAMIVLAGLGSFFVGSSLQSVMPVFAHAFGAGDATSAYGVLLFANGAGGVVGGLVLEATGWVRPNVAAAVASTVVYAVAMLGFAVTGSLVAAVALLAVGGMANLVSMSVGQTVVQLRAPAADRGRVVGVYAMSANGLKVGSGFTVGLLGAVVGVHWSLGLSAAALAVCTVAAGAYALRPRPGRLLTRA